MADYLVVLREWLSGSALLPRSARTTFLFVRRFEFTHSKQKSPKWGFYVLAGAGGLLKYFANTKYFPLSRARLY